TACLGDDCFWVGDHSGIVKLTSCLYRSAARSVAAYPSVDSGSPACRSHSHGRWRWRRFPNGPEHGVTNTARRLNYTSEEQAGESGSLSKHAGEAGSLSNRRSRAHHVKHCDGLDYETDPTSSQAIAARWLAIMICRDPSSKRCVKLFG